MGNNTKTTLTIPKKEVTEEIKRLEACNLELVIGLERLHEAIMNHKLNSKSATAEDYLLWETVDSIIEFK